MELVNCNSTTTVLVILGSFLNIECLDVNKEVVYLLVNDITVQIYII